jgi:hypothetical protein
MQTYIVNLNIEYVGVACNHLTSWSARQKVQEAAEKTGEAISRGQKESWGKTKCYGKELKKELSRVHRRTERNKTSKRRRKRKGDEQ